MDKLNLRRKTEGGTGRKELSYKNTQELGAILGNQALSHLHQTEGGVVSGEVVQRERGQVCFTKKETLSPNDLSEMYDQIKAQIDEISEEEGPFVNWVNVGRWQGQYEASKAQIDVVFKADEAVSLVEIKAGQGNNQYFRSALITINNLRKELNDSWKDFNESQALMQEAEAERLSFTSGKQEQKKSPDSQKTVLKPDAKALYHCGQYLPDIEGAVALIAENVVVIVEHYQLKHNTGMGVLLKGGAYKGSTGSQLDGGWKAHETIFAPAIYQCVKDNLSELSGKTAKKQRLDQIEAYISVTEEDGIYYVTYHGNPPGMA